MSAPVPVISVKHLSGGCEYFELDTSLKLKDIRIILSDNKFMFREDKFIYNNEAVAHSDEAHRTLLDVLDGDNQLNIGA